MAIVVGVDFHEIKFVTGIVKKMLPICSYFSREAGRSLFQACSRSTWGANSPNTRDFNRFRKKQVYKNDSLISGHKNKKSRK
jgi:hypothetical protein